LLNKIFNFLHGKWIFQRTISEHGKVQGHACFNKINNCHLHYFETGIFTDQNNNNYAIHQEYEYIFEDEKIAVYFCKNKTEKSLFYFLNFISPNYRQATGEHLCNKDLYQATYTFENSEKFILEYKINGPEKNYRIKTIFAR